MLDLSRLLPGAYCSLLLADLGMEVLKIEEPQEGDYFRKMGPMGRRDSRYFLAVNRNKKSMTLNLKKSEGREIFYKLIESYDVILESFRPGVMERLGVGYQELEKRNPRVILCSISGYGQDGPYRERSGHDINYIGLAGILDLTGSENGDPVVPGVQIADIGGGSLMSTIAILASIFHREKTGEGQHLDISMLDGIFSWLSLEMANFSAFGEIPKRGETLLTGKYACYHVYQSKDGGYMSLGALEEKFWKNFCEAVDRKDLIGKQFVDGEERLWLIEEIRSLFRSKTQEEWINFLKNVDACCEPVLTLKELFRHPQIIHREMVKEIQHPVEGMIQQISNPIRSSHHAFEIQTLPPSMGEHTEEILKKIGYSQKDIHYFREMKVV